MGEEEMKNYLGRNGEGYNNEGGNTKRDVGLSY
jgi:hypothetical protein